ncbi:hypothetical protein [Alcaligenes faecalis]|uniref:hypothetical protein n=1 Tax=Alcaligenes faecalis TaxID=511 RepID=UPI001EE40664|nr:hypothetical protein [Alcaligenes faecalis]
MSIVISLFRAGRFSYWVSGPREYVINPTLAAWEGDYANGKYDGTWWFYGGQVRKRQVCPVMVEGGILYGVRAGSVISIEGQQYECPEGGDIELSFQFPGTYEVTVSCWPYLDGSYTVENPPPTQ